MRCWWPSCIFGGGDGYKVTARFLNAGQLVKGNEVQLGGVNAGTVDEIKITDDGRADVTLKVKEEFVPLPVGTRAVIKQRSLSGIANRFVDIQLGDGDGAKIEDGGMIGRTRPTPRSSSTSCSTSSTPWPASPCRTSSRGRAR